MADSATNLDLITTNQQGKEITANAVFDAASPATFGGRRASTSVGLTWGLYGGKAVLAGSVTNVGNATVLLSASTTNFVEWDPVAGTFSTNTTGFTAGRMPLYTVVTGASSVTSYTDQRAGAAPVQPRISFSVAGGVNVTLSNAQARADIIELTGAITANIAVIFPTQPRLYALLNNTTGAFKLTARTSAGSGVQLPRGQRVMVYVDGTDVQPLTVPAFAQSLAYAAAITVDASKGERIVVGALTGALTINAPTNPQLGAALEFAFLQDGTGGRVITWNAAFKKAADGAGTANQRASTRYLYDGTNWIQQGGALAWFT